MCEDGKCEPKPFTGCIDALQCPPGQLCGPDYSCRAGEPGESCSRNDHCQYSCGEDGLCGTGAAGDPCGGPSDCSDARACVEGRCAARRQEECGASIPCATDLVCGPAKCQDGARGDPCETDAHCAAGEHCGPAGTCLPGVVGDPCSQDTECQMGLFCGPNGCQAGATGDACADAADCKERCGPTGSCQSGSMGDACSAEVHCATGLQCTAAGTCAVFTYNPANIGARVHRETFKTALTCTGLSTNSDTGEASCGGQPLYWFPIKQNDAVAPGIAVFMVNSLTIPAGGRWNVRGKRPTLLLAADFVQVDGDIVVEASSKAGTGSNVCSTPRAQGTPLVGGADGLYAFDGKGFGGGALQISAARRVEVGTLGVIAADGANAASTPGAGGGDGGSIVLEAPSVTVRGSVRVNYGMGPAASPQDRGDGGVIVFRALANAPSATCGGVPSTLAPFTLGAAPTCASLPAPSASCDQCKAEMCCAEHAACQANQTCTACSAPGQGGGTACTSNAPWQQYRICMSSWCPKCTP